MEGGGEEEVVVALVMLMVGGFHFCVAALDSCAVFAQKMEGETGAEAIA